MAVARTCPQCGGTLPDEGWEGLCPKCLVRVSLEPPAPEAQLRPEDPSQVPRSEEAPNSLGKTVVAPESEFLSERIGTMIGRYKLLQQIGEGGFGIVFMAEQQEPVQRKVALKIIKA